MSPPESSGGALESGLGVAATGGTGAVACVFDELETPRPINPIRTSQVVGETAKPIIVSMLDAAAAQKPEALNPEALRSRLTRENKTAKGRKISPNVNIPKIANRHPKMPDITPALDRAL